MGERGAGPGMSGMHSDRDMSSCFLSGSDLKQGIPHVTCSVSTIKVVLVV